MSEENVHMYIGGLVNCLMMKGFKRWVRQKANKYEKVLGLLVLPRQNGLVLDKKKTINGLVKQILLKVF